MLFTVKSLSNLAAGSSLAEKLPLQYGPIAKTQSYFTSSCTLGLNSATRVTFQ